ncbi:MAG: ferric reductase-like transmembrane domain-containing protein [Micrococcales bacterium]
MNQMIFTQPNQKVRLGMKKYLELKRGQDFIEGLAWFSVIAVTAMFLIDGGLKTFTDPSSILGAIDRLTALVATNLLLIDILLIARIPWIDHYYGHDRATTAHKKLGKPILYLVLAHFIASVVQYAIVANVDVITEFLSLLSIGDILLATGALVLMIMVVVTSLNFARKAVTYEAWYLVHIFAYGAVLLAIPHQFSTGSDIAGKPIAMTYWIALYLFVLVNVVWYRILRPILRGLRHSLRVSTVVRESSDAVSIYLTGKNIAKLGGAAGQFYLVRILTARDWWRPHPFSISAAPNNKFVRFTVADRGDDTKLMQSLKPGTPIMLEGPYGVFTEERRTREKVVLVAAGIGIPPIRALAEQMAARPHDVTIIYRLRSQEDAALLDETRAIAAQRGFRLIELEGRRGVGTSWMNADFSGRSDLERLKDLVPDITESDVYICGPTAWTRNVEKTMKAAGVEERQIHAEEFAW